MDKKSFHIQRTVIFRLRLFKVLILLILLPFFSTAATKTWNGGAAGSWNVAGNWSPSGIPTIATSPAAGDDIIFDGSLASTVTITDYPAYISTQQFGKLTLSNGVTVNINGSADTYMLFFNGLVIPAGTRINIGAATTTIFIFGSSSNLLADVSLIYGTIEIKGTGANAITNKKAFQAAENFSAGISRLYGTLIISGPSATFISTTSTFVIETGGEMQWARDGVSSAVSPFIYNDGSVINITGIVTLPMILSNFGQYYGLILWNCPSQTGQGIPVIPSVGLTFHVDSIRIVNTGTGSASLGTSPCYSAGHLEVQGGTMYLGSPTAATCAGLVITSDLKITGGTVIGNATFAGDAASAYPITLAVNRDFIMTGGTFNFSNRPSGLSPGGAMILNVGRNVTQTGGSIFSTSSFGSQNQVNLNGTAAQTLELSNLADVGVVITNSSATQGVTLSNNLTIASSSALVLSRGYLAVGNYSLTVPANRFFQNVFTPMPRIVTNGSGKIKLTGIAASSSQVFPVSPITTNSYNPLTIATNASATLNDYAVRIEYGNTPAGIYSPAKTIKRTWIITPTTAITANTVGLTFQYNDSSKGSACTATANMELGHFAGGIWNIDPSATLLTPAGSNPYTVGPYYPNSLDSAFVVGNRSSILAMGKEISLTAQKQLNESHLVWSVNSTINIVHFIIERSANGNDYIPLYTAGATVFDFDDINQLKGLNYYRIKMTDINGNIVYSNIAVVLNAVNGVEIISISPNPVISGTFKFSFASARANKIELMITDISGRIVMRQSNPAIAGFNSIDINVSNLASGTYTIGAITTDEKTRVMRFVKE